MLLPTLVPALISQEMVCDFLLVFELRVAGLVAFGLLLFDLLLCLYCMQADAWDEDWKVLDRPLVVLSGSILLVDLVDELLDWNAFDAAFRLSVCCP
jgi:hypothetical protein